MTTFIPCVAGVCAGETKSVVQWSARQDSRFRWFPGARGIQDRAVPSSDVSTVKIQCFSIFSNFYLCLSPHFSLVTDLYLFVLFCLSIPLCAASRICPGVILSDYTTIWLLKISEYGILQVGEMSSQFSVLTKTHPTYRESITSSPHTCTDTPAQLFQSYGPYGSLHIKWGNGRSHFKYIFQKCHVTDWIL